MVDRARQPTHICEMMEHLGIEPGGGVVPRWSLAYTTAFHRCEGCTNKQACRDWLANMPALVSFAPRFCPNADIFFELQVEQPRTDRSNGCVELKSDPPGETEALSTKRYRAARDYRKTYWNCRAFDNSHLEMNLLALQTAPLTAAVSHHLQLLDALTKILIDCGIHFP